MAEMAVSFAIDQLLPLLREEGNLLKGIHKEFGVIKDEFESIQAFLKDAERRATAEGDNRDEGIKTWVKQVTEAAFRIEDIIDEYMIYVGQQPRDPGCADILTKTAHLIKTLIPRHRIASEIQDIKSSVHGIKERSLRYSFQIQSSFEQGSSSSGESQNVKWHDPRRASLYIEDAELVGFEGPRDKLINWLVESAEKRMVISVVGMGGLGKTTLANRVFKNQKVIEHFDCHAWVTVSQSYNVEGLLRDILKKFYKEKREDPARDISEMDQDSLIQEVRNYLLQKRYVVVFDDVWDVKLWDEIKFAVFDNKMGSRILITTRKMDVAMSCKNSSFAHVHELQPLTFDKSLELFYKKAFPLDFNGCFPNDLVNISSEIVKKCKGLPLAIVVIGGLLSRKEKTSFEWERFSCNLSSELEKDYSISKILGFSYHDLPYCLKSCLLYFGMYPEDFKIRSKRLIQQWIAEGFVKYEKGKTLEEVAEQYLTELIDRCLVQVSSFSMAGKVKYCRVHDLTREMILQKCKDLIFCQYISGDDEPTPGGIVRRQSIATKSGDFIESTKVSHVRSLFVFLYDTENYVTKFLKNYKLLKVLDFENAKIFDYFPKNLGNLIHLKYLSFKGAAVKDSSLPESIGKLQNLETLNVRDSSITIMPKEICKLRKLRHLLGNRLCLVEVKDGIEGMTSLQTLKYVDVNDDEDGVKTIKALKKLRQLREVGFVIHIGECDESGVCSLLNEIKQLEKKDIVVESTNDLNWVSSPPKPVLKLLVEGKLNKLPEQVQELHNLVKLVLWGTKLIKEPLKSLKNLPNLYSLYFVFNAYLGEGLDFEEGGFQKLKNLLLGQMINLKSITINKGAMSCLKKLTLADLDKVERVPSGIQYLDKLQHLIFWRMPKGFKKISADGGEDHWIINHVPRVYIFNSSQ